MKTIALKDAAAMIPDGASLLIGGFMAVGTPERLVDELVRQGKRNLTVIANDTAMPGRGIGKLVSAGLIVRTIASHIGLNPETQQQMIGEKWPSIWCRRVRSSSVSVLVVLVLAVF
jgi:acetate CoA/acetoacetate CoA-transferase alpha subunit